jgi:transketolase
MLVLRPADANEVAVAWRVALEQTGRPVMLVLTRQDLPTLDRKIYGPAEGVARGGYILADAAETVVAQSPSIVVARSPSIVVARSPDRATGPTEGLPSAGADATGPTEGLPAGGAVETFGRGEVRGRETRAQQAQQVLPDVILLATGSEVQLAIAAHEQLVADGIRSRVVSLPSFELFDAQPAAYRDEVLPPSVMARVAVEAGVRQCWDKYLGAAGAFIGLDTYGASAPYQDIYKHRGLTAEAVLAKAREVCRR